MPNRFAGIAIWVSSSMLGALSFQPSNAGAQEAKSGPQIEFGGYMKVDFIHDFDPIGNVFEFKTDAIPVDGSPAADQAGQTTIHARESRLTASVAASDTPHGPFRAYLEGDFYGDGTTFRIRHAYGEYMHFLGGQTWTTFMDISARPRSLDHEGPDGEIFVRQAMIRWGRAIGQRWKFAIAAEQPGGQFSVPDSLSGSSRSEVPDFPAFLRCEGKRGHLQIAAIVRQIRFDGEAGSADVSTAGFGGNVSGRLSTRGKSGLMGEISFGEGIGRYVESLSGQNADAVFSSPGELEALAAYAFVVGYEHHWRQDLQSTLAFAMVDLDENNLLSPSTIKQTQDARVNLIWAPDRRVDVGGEVLYGRRKNQNDAEGDALRFQFSMIYKI